MINTKVKIRKNGFDIEKAELHDIENVESKIYEKYILFIADKLINDYSNMLPSKQIYQTEIEKYRNYLYQFSDDEVDIANLEINAFLLVIRKSLPVDNVEKIVEIDNREICITSKEIDRITQDYVEDWLAPELLSWIEDTAILLEIEECFGDAFRKHVVENFVSYGINVVEKKENHRGIPEKTSIFYKEKEIIAAEEFEDGVEVDVEIEKSLSDGLILACQWGEEQKNICVHFPVFIQGDVIHLKVSVSAGVAVLFITYVRFNLTVKKAIWGTD